MNQHTANIRGPHKTTLKERQEKRLLGYKYNQHNKGTIYSYVKKLKRHNRRFK